MGKSASDCPCVPRMLHPESNYLMGLRIKNGTTPLRSNMLEDAYRESDILKDGHDFHINSPSLPKLKLLYIARELSHEQLCELVTNYEKSLVGKLYKTYLPNPPQQIVKTL